MVRQTLFNALVGTGPQANAYYAAFQLPDTLFSLIAGGALIQAFVPVFFSVEREHGRQETWRLASLVFNVMLAAAGSAMIEAGLLCLLLLWRLEARIEGKGKS